MEITNEASNKKYWIKDHPEFYWAPGTLVSEDETYFQVSDNEGEKFKIPKEKAIEVKHCALKGVPDLLLLNDFNEAALLNSIRVRYNRDEIYTSVGFPICISINPYKTLDIYNN